LESEGGIGVLRKAVRVLCASVAILTVKYAERKAQRALIKMQQINICVFWESVAILPQSPQRKNTEGAKVHVRVFRASVAILTTKYAERKAQRALSKM